MRYILFLLIFLQIISLFLSLVKTGGYRRISKNIRFFFSIFGVLFFAYWFTQKSNGNFLEKSMSIQVVNKLNQPIDVYAIKVINKDKNQFLSKHLGKIRSNHYQIEYFDMSNSNEFWVVGYIGKHDLVYFSQHAVHQKEEDQKIEIRNYLNQSVKLSAQSNEVVEKLQLTNTEQSIWVTLCLILLFLNLVLLSRKN
jgi:5-enolpyruvylshikimate-3-phosphate synthase